MIAGLNTLVREEVEQHYIWFSRKPATNNKFMYYFTYKTPTTNDQVL